MPAATARQHRVFAALLIALLTSGPARAQTARVPGQLPAPDPAAAIADMLRSDDAREQAWGAHYAGRDQLRQLVPELHQLISSRLGDQSQAAAAAVAIALDALIQMQSPAADLLPLIYELRPVEALILASLVDKPETDSFLLDVMQSAESELWFSAANLLLQKRSRALAPALLDGLRITLKVYLVDDGMVFGGGRGGGGVGCGGIGQATGLPPWPAYDLSTYPNSGLTILATGPVSVYYRRIVAPAGQTPGFCDSFTAGPSGEHRMQYLAALAGIRAEDLPVRGYEQHSIPSRGGTSAVIDGEISKIKADVGQRFGRLLKMLVSAGVVGASAAAGRQPVIDLEIDDRRSGR